MYFHPLILTEAQKQQRAARRTESVTDGYRRVAATLELGAKAVCKRADQREGRDALPPTDVREHATLGGKERV